MDFTGKIKNIKMEGVGDIENVEILVSTPNLSIIPELEKAFQANKDMNISIKRIYGKRSLNANAYFHVLVNKLARHFNISDEEMKIKMNLQYGAIARDENNKCVGVKIPEGTDITKFYKYAKWFGDCVEGGIKFNKYLFYKETHTLNTREMMELIEGIQQECLDAGISIEEKDKVDKMVENWKPEGD